MMIMNITNAPELADLVTFLPNRTEPIHNWYWYKEGYSRALVERFLKEFKPRNVLDPFCGVGTTLLTCKQNSIESIGFDTSPIAVFVSRVKTRDYDLESLKAAAKLARSWKFVAPKKLPQDKWIVRAFSKYALQDAVFYKNNILEMEDENSRDFLLLALIDSALKASYAFKDGAYVKIRKETRPPLKILFRNKVHRMVKQLETNPVPQTCARAEIGDARKLDVADASIDAVITSPPYLNKIEYTTIYKIENSLFFSLPETSLRSYIGSDINETTDFPQMPPAAQAYFTDMAKVMKELRRVCKPGAKLAIVIGGGCFPTEVVNVDEVLVGIAESIGFKCEKVLAAREMWCTRAANEKVGRVRESVVILEA